ncbi:MAG TPA: OmpA family protein [Puia sp.]|nr:OmpA family protein [Puia sp.]
MKRIWLFAGSFLLTLSLFTAQAQVNDPGQVGRDAATNRANSDMDNAANNGVDKAEQGVRNLFKKKNKNTNTNSSNSSSAQSEPQDNANGAAPAQSVKSYQNYDFVAGDKIIFSDNFTDDQDGEFPAHWNLEKGQATMNKVQSVPSFALTDGNYVVVSPKMTTTNYLPKEFTVEFDTYFEPNAYGILLRFRVAGETNDSNGDLSVNSGEISFDGASDANISLHASMPSAIAEENYQNKWHHIAVGFKNRQMKVYVDQYRVLVVPDVKVDYATLNFAGIGSQDAPIIFTNVKIAEGGSQNMIGNILTNGKFITHGITFDVDKSVIRPESMGVLNQVAKFLKDNPSVKMEIDGHTDNSGAAAHNLTLSQQRADAVKAQLVSMGIDGSRFTTKGFGDTKPIADNGTPEGKANNRRVEFVKTS